MCTSWICTILTATMKAMQAVVKVNVSGFIDLFGLFAKPSWMSNWCPKLFSSLLRFFALILNESIIKCIGKFCFELRVISLKFFNSFMEFKNFMISDIHGKLKFIDSIAQIFSFRKNTPRVFAIKKNTKVFEGTIKSLNFFNVLSRFIMSHGVLGHELTKLEHVTVITRFMTKVNIIFEIKSQKNRSLTMGVFSLT